ncbi:nuclear cap-binding protein subunit 3 [Diachasma alloeum]|uniref:nuclear cap-binding protein subunit 3 n=1 Tax=Diachasma alloeum TaxID=454923 RepID=UPI000738254D|nr:nuclear cap-binding protein subunit 3 [Diachasma alloeum]
MEEPMEVETTFREEESGEDVGGTADSDEGVIEDDNFVVETRHENKGGAFTTGIDIFGEEERRKMQERAKRFGLSKNDGGLENEEELYSSMGVDEDNENSKHIRLNVLHMRGTEEMSTKDVFKYFEHYPAAAIEWINDVSCNVVWLDNVSAARALLGLSKRIIGLRDHLEIQEKGRYTHEDNLIEVDDPKNESTINLKDVECPLPPGLWRKGVDSPKSKGIFLRFATRNDKKQPRAEKMSEYYKKYGNPNFGGMRGILTESRKRQYKQIRTVKPRRSSETSENDEKERGKNPWGELSENWGAHEDVEDNYIRRGFSERPERGNVKERLGLKPTKEIERREVVVEVSSSEDSGSNDSEEEWAKRSKIPRMRMHADDEEEKVKKKKLKELTRKKQEESADLRSRLGRRKPPPIYREDIQVIVTNTPEKYRSRRTVEEEEEEEEEVEEVEEDEVEDSEKEEGEWEEVEGPFEEEDESESSSSDSDISEKEIQGPKGSVIKVVPRYKPRVASTVWARLNVKGQSDNSQADSGNSRKLKADLRSRLGHQKRERSPLRIEVKNEKYKRRDDAV